MKAKIFFPIFIIFLLLTINVSAGFFDTIGGWFGSDNKVIPADQAQGSTELNLQIAQLNSELSIAKQQKVMVKYQCFDGSLASDIKNCLSVEQVACRNSTNNVVIVAPNQGCPKCPLCPSITCRGKELEMIVPEGKVLITNDGSMQSVPKDDKPDCVADDPAISNVFKGAAFFNALKPIINSKTTSSLDSLSVQDSDKIKEDYGRFKIGIPGQGTCHLNDGLTDTKLSCLINAFKPYLIKNEEKNKGTGLDNTQGFWDSMTDQEKETELFNKFSTC